jgi:phosphoribosylformylglycinamidine (FGAM) synthase-like enzyme
VFLLRGAGAELVRFVWEHAHDFSLAHDVSHGGAALALREAAAWSGLEADVRAVDGEGAIVACAEPPDWHDVVELGTV